MHPDIRMWIAALAAAAGSWTALPVQAVANFDFEDGTLQSWQTSTTGGSGSTTVELHNGSKAAYVLHTGSGTHALSHDFPYVTTDLLKFDMHAISVPSGRGDPAYSGVIISFLNAFNVSQGSVSFFNATNPADLGPRQFPVDNLPHNYSASMGDFATLAGINPATVLATVTVSFATAASTSFFGDASVAKVWADNIMVGIPEPSERWLMLAGLAALVLVTLRRPEAGAA